MTNERDERREAQAEGVFAAWASRVETGEELDFEELVRAHGQLEPKETAAWESTMWHLFDLVFVCAKLTWDAEVAECGAALADLVDEVGARAEELVVFEDSAAEYSLGQSRDAARR